MLERLRYLGFSGPLLVAPGDLPQLEKFLELRPNVPRHLMFVDPSQSFAAHRGVGIGSLLEGPAPDVSLLALKAPDMGGFDNILGYMSSVMDLAPSNLDGVRLLGATLVIHGDRIIFASADRVPGDYPKPADVLRAIDKKLA